MPTDPPVHAYSILTAPTGERIQIDEGMTAVIGELWAHGFATTGCCQDVGQATAGVRAKRDRPLGYGGDAFIDYHRGWALLKLPTPDAMRLVKLLAAQPAFSDRVTLPWRPGSWRMNVPLEPEGLAGSALLHYPKEQTEQLVELLMDLQ
ncbi:hypothetical protein AB0L54_34485 [Streptomyces sp. NPDC052196]|uniref:hypothetical protein n=1 Tax=Streptomyces sp. NPDC052196 TaxID=3156691 RepID=UPI00342AB101